MTAVTRYPDVWRVRQRYLRVALAVGTLLLVVVLFRRVEQFTASQRLRSGGPYDADYDVLNPARAPATSYHGALRFQYPTCDDGCRILSRVPFIAHYPSFVTDADCDAIVAAAHGRLSTSLAVDQGARTSSQVWMDPAKGGAVPPAITRLRDRLADLSGLNDTEPVQVVRYLAGEQYGAHTDYFDDDPQDDNRAVTHSVYLATVVDGGETWFPRANGGPMPRDNRSCEGGLRVRPVKGDMLVHYNMLPSTGRGDPFSLHGGCPVHRDVKWIAQVWMWST